jgi:murein L,D-transpeptidase YcbB/YkuD
MVSRMTYRLAFGAILARFLFCSFVAGSFAAPAFAGPALASVEAALQAKIDSLYNFVDRPAERDALRTFYAERGYRPFWVDQSGPTHAAANLIAELGRAGDWGLRSADFQAPAANAPLNEGRWPVDDTAAAEYEISALVLKYARQARGGRIAEPDRMLSSYLDRRPVLPDPARVLALVTTAAAPDEALRSFHPQNEQFQRLHDLLAKLRAEPGETAVAQLPAQGPSLVPGARHADIAVLRQHLDVTATPGSENVYDAALAAAVKTFQSGADLDDDGIVGPATRKALNAAVIDRRASIIANMEQWRWMPDDLGATHLFVNVPAFSIDLVRDGASVLQERVITGKSTTQTPIFSKQLTAIVLKPLWYLPDSIKLEKLLAAQRTGSPIEGEGYLVKHGSHIVDSSSVDWNTANLKEYSIYQPSGDGNALGDVKFLFPNKHSVYLHDTPNKALFDAPRQPRLHSPAQPACPGAAPARRRQGRRRLEREDRYPQRRQQHAGHA